MATRRKLLRREDAIADIQVRINSLTNNDSPFMVVIWTVNDREQAMTANRVTWMFAPNLFDRAVELVKEDLKSEAEEIDGRGLWAREPLPVAEHILRS